MSLCRKIHDFQDKKFESTTLEILSTNIYSFNQENEK